MLFGGVIAACVLEQTNRRPPADELDTRDPSVAVAAFYRDLDDVRVQCHALRVAIEAGDVAAVATAARAVTAGWLAAQATLEIITAPIARAPLANTALLAGRYVIGHLFARAWTRLSGGQADEAQLRAVLRQLGAALARASAQPNLGGARTEAPTCHSAYADVA